MGRDNKDRYGYRHRQDQSHDMGDAKPGDIGDSKGTFHDRARQDQNVIVDEKVQSIESHQRSTAEVDNKSQQQNRSSTSGERISQNEAVGTTVTVQVEDHGGTLDTIAQYKNHQVHLKGGTPGEKRRIKLKKGEGYLIGEPVKAGNKR